MGKAEILERVQDIFRDVLGDSSLTITEDTSADKVEGWDSLAQISIVSAIADEFQISPSIDEILAMKSVEKIIEIVQASVK